MDDLVIIDRNDFIIHRATFIKRTREYRVYHCHHCGCLIKVSDM